MLPYLSALVVCILLIAIYDRSQRSNPVLRVYPIIGRIPGLLRHVREITRADTTFGLPFSEDELKDIRGRALTGSAVSSFGAIRARESHRFLTADVAILPSHAHVATNVSIANQQDTLSIAVPILNFGALGFGPVSENTIRAIAFAASEVGCLQNTGEDGLTAIHSSENARLIWQIGTGYWGCRNSDGSFSETLFAESAASPTVELIELKLSQGAKPGAGGLLPAAKNTPRVARILGVEPRVDIVSPPWHTAFSNVEEMLEFIAKLESLGEGKPVGLKLCVGSIRSAKVLVDAITRTGITPAFMTIDSGDGGTGAAKSELQNYTGLLIDDAVSAISKCLQEAGKRGQTILFAAGRVTNGFDLFRLICLGADGAFFTRGPMIAMGCVQARRCHTGSCPAGIATQDWWRRTAISATVQGRQLASYYRTVLEGYQALLCASGRDDVSQLDEDCLITLSGASLSSTLERQ